jgi:hypothetical protein
MIFKTNENVRNEKSVGATLYPSQIIIETRNKKNDFSWYSTDHISILPHDTTNEVLGSTIIQHLKNSKLQDITSQEIKALRDNFKRVTKLKTDKAIHDNAQYVSIYLIDTKVRIEPFKNKANQKSFYRLPDKIFSFDLPDHNNDLVLNIRKAWDSCVFE